jgi:hypothetical protein
VRTSDSRVAYNPLPWSGAVPPPAELAAILRPAGLHAIQADVPDGMTAADFGWQLDAVGLAPAPGYFQAPFEDAGRLRAALESARRVAAAHAELGLSEVFLACTLNETRVVRPGQGVDPDPDRLSRIAEHIARTSVVMAGEGVRPFLPAALGVGFSGGIVIEVDAFDLPTPEESVAATGAWVRANLDGRRRA